MSMEYDTEEPEMAFFAGSPIITGGMRNAQPGSVRGPQPGPLGGAQIGGIRGVQQRVAPPVVSAPLGLQRHSVAPIAHSSLSHGSTAVAAIMRQPVDQPPGRMMPQHQLQKRRRVDEEPFGGANKGNGMSDNYNQPPRSPRISVRGYLKLPTSAQTFHTEEWKTRQTTVYKPLLDDVMINTANLEQISFSCGTFFVGDESGTYCGSREGNVINLWRYDNSERKMFVARSLLFTSQESYENARRQLEDL